MQKLFILIAIASLLGACSQSEQASESSAPDETAQQFIDRVNDEYRDWWRELNAAGWLRATYIND
jgi:peptidyl-dipeptidase A